MVGAAVRREGVVVVVAGLRRRRVVRSHPPGEHGTAILRARMGRECSHSG